MVAGWSIPGARPDAVNNISSRSLNLLTSILLFILNVLSSLHLYTAQTYSNCMLFNNHAFVTDRQQLYVQCMRRWGYILSDFSLTSLSFTLQPLALSSSPCFSDGQRCL